MRRLERAVRQIADGVPRVLAPAINRALNKGRTTVKREIRKQYVIKAKDIPVMVRGANRARLSGEVRIQQGMMDLAKFKVTPKGVQKRKHKRPIRAQVRVGGGKLIPHGFVAAMPSGYTGPFTRKGPDRLPIRHRLTIGAPIMASQPTVGPAVNKAMGDELAKNIDSQIVRVMAKGGT
jgi:hypothetical protein